MSWFQFQRPGFGIAVSVLNPGLLRSYPSAARIPSAENGGGGAAADAEAADFVTVKASEGDKVRARSAPRAPQRTSQLPWRGS